MSLVLVGLNHKTAPVEIREKFYFSDAALENILKEIVDGTIIEEGAILSTCNRTEIYAWGPRNLEIVEELKNFLACFGNVPLSSLKKFFYDCCGDSAARHLFEVASGLDSMILGEGQILGQVKKSFSIAQDSGQTGPVLNKFFNTAVKAGKRARAETDICKGASSISYAAVELAKRIFGDLVNCKILLVGAGEMSELAVKLLVSSGVQFIMVANRTFEKAEEIACAYGGQAILFDKLSFHLNQADVVITSTSAPHFVLSRQAIQASLKLRKGRPLFIVDIAVPRDVEPSAGELDNVYLYNIDDLEEAVNHNLLQRSQEIEKVKKIINEELSEFRDFLTTNEVVPVIKNMRRSFEVIGRNELERFISKDSLTEKEKSLLENFYGSLLNKLLHTPTLRLKEMSRGKIDSNTVTALKNLFEAGGDKGGEGQQ